MCFEQDAEKKRITHGLLFGFFNTDCCYLEKIQLGTMLASAGIQVQQFFTQPCLYLFQKCLVYCRDRKRMNTQVVSVVNLFAFVIPGYSSCYGRRMCA